jgi:TolB-like protein/class 3 adenylate cyclase/Tfp pilus assembly protein PilF
MSQARRLAAILAADAVDYSRLISEDEAGTARLVRERREAALPIVRAFGGRLVKTTGDGLLLEFSSVVAAVECAIAIQRMMVERNAAIPEARGILYRVGVNLSDILIDGDDILGDGVNAAARLEGLAEPGGISLSEDAYRQVRDKVKGTFIDLGEKALKNIVRPMRVYALKPASEIAATPSVAPLGKGEPPRLSLVVLPFANIGGDPEQDYFVDGVTESLTTDLSRISGAFIIGRSTAFTHNVRAADLKQIGRELNVRYVLEGSVQRSGSRMRVNVQLIEAETGKHLWAERFDKPIADLFDMQDEIVARLANQLHAEMIAAEARRAEQSPNPDSMDLYFRGRAAQYRSRTPDTLAKARGFYQRALELDPGNIDALVGVAAVDVIVSVTFMTDDPQTLLAEAEARLTKALARVPDNALAHLHLGTVLRATNRGQRSIEELERALAIDPNLVAARAAIGVTLVWMGRAEEAEAHVLEALRLSPRDAMVFEWLLVGGVAKMYLGEFAEAVTWLRKSIDANRDRPLAYFLLAACLAHLGRLDEARREVKSGLAFDPKFTLRRYADVQSDNALFLARRARVAEGMRLAGVPEG